MAASAIPAAIRTFQMLWFHPPGTVAAYSSPAAEVEPAAAGVDAELRVEVDRPAGDMDHQQQQEGHRDTNTDGPNTLAQCPREADGCQHDRNDVESRDPDCGERRREVDGIAHGDGDDPQRQDERDRADAAAEREVDEAKEQAANRGEWDEGQQQTR